MVFVLELREGDGHEGWTAHPRPGGHPFHFPVLPDDCPVPAVLPKFVISSPPSQLVSSMPLPETSTIRHQCPGAAAAQRPEGSYSNPSPRSKQTTAARHRCVYNAKRSLAIQPMAPLTSSPASLPGSFCHSKLTFLMFSVHAKEAFTSGPLHVLFCAPIPSATAQIPPLAPSTSISPCWNSLL